MGFVYHEVRVKPEPTPGVVKMRDMPPGSIGILLDINAQSKPVIMRMSKHLIHKDCKGEVALDIRNGDTMYGMDMWGDKNVLLLPDDCEVIITVKNEGRKRD